MPVSIGFFFQTMFNVTDTYFAGLHSPEALAGCSISFPVIFVLFALSSGLSSGTTALLAQAFGKGDREEVKTLSAQLLSLVVLITIPVAITLYSTAESILMMIGAEGAYLAEATAYAQTIYLGMISFMLVSACNAGLMASGDSKKYSHALIGSFFS